MKPKQINMYSKVTFRFVGKKKYCSINSTDTINYQFRYKIKLVSNLTRFSKRNYPYKHKNKCLIIRNIYETIL